jgi:stress response protein SCP2
MAVSLQKGQSVNLAKEAATAGNAGETKFVAGAGWDPKSGTPVDLDLMAVLLGSDGKALPDENSNGTNLDEAVVFYNNKSLSGLQLSEDDLTGQSSDGGDDETLQIDTTTVDQKVQKVVISISSFSGQSFDEVENAYGRIVDSKGTELARVDLAAHAGKKAVVVGCLERDGSDWSFKNDEQDFADVQALFSNYGVTGA